MGNLVRTPSVTVILPAKDAARFIGTTLETLTRQFSEDTGFASGTASASTDAIKLVLIDDGSRDETQEIMRTYAERFAHVELIVNDNPVGLASARNQGLAHVTTDQFTFLDADDWMQPLRLESLSTRLRELDVDFLRTDHVTVTGEVRELKRAPAVWRERALDPREYVLPLYERSMVDYPYAWAGILHSRLLDDGTAYFSAGLHTAEDRPWIWRLHLQAKSFAVVDAPALLYRRGDDNSLSQVRDRRQLDFAPAMSEVLELATADRDSATMVPKAVQSILALSAHHIVKSRKMAPALRSEMRSSIRSLLATLPAAETQEVLGSLDAWRRRLIAKIVRQAQAS